MKPRPATFLALLELGWRSPLRWLVLASLGAYVAAVALDTFGHGGAICGTTTTLDQLRMLRFQIDAGLITPSGAARDWALMIAVMMAPLLSQPIARVITSVRLDVRPWAVGGFLVGYGAVWSISAIILIPLGLALNAATQATGWIGAAAWISAFAWSCTPMVQEARNRMHAPPGLRGFGAGAIQTSVRYGFRAGASCFVTCWPWMIAPFALGAAHQLAMPLIAAYLLIDRMELPTAARWRWPPIIDLLLSRATPTATLGQARL